MLRLPSHMQTGSPLRWPPTERQRRAGCPLRIWIPSMPPWCLLCCLLWKTSGAFCLPRGDLTTTGDGDCAQLHDGRQVLGQSKEVKGASGLGKERALEMKVVGTGFLQNQRERCGMREGRWPAVDSGQRGGCFGVGIFGRRGNGEKRRDEGDAFGLFVRPGS